VSYVYSLSSQPYDVAPEIIDPSVSGPRGMEERLDLRAADVYSLGCTINQLLAREPFAELKRTDEPSSSLAQGDSTTKVQNSIKGLGVDMPGQVDKLGTSIAQWGAPASREYAMFKILERRLREVPPSVDAMMEGVLEGVPRRCVEITRMCLLPAPERPSPEDVAAIFREAYEDATMVQTIRI